MPHNEDSKVKIEFTPFMVIEGSDCKPQKKLGQINILSFYDLIGVAIDRYVKDHKLPDTYKASFYQDYPVVDDNKFDTRYNVITAGIHKRLRGNTGKAGNRDRRPLKATFSRSFHDKANPGHGIIEEFKLMENHIKFTIASKNKKSADMIALWFETMMEEQRAAILLAGIDQYFFMERLADKKEKILGTELFIREILYFVRTQESYYYHTKTIESVLIQVGLIFGNKEITTQDGKIFKLYGDKKIEEIKESYNGTKI